MPIPDEGRPGPDLDPVTLGIIERSLEYSMTNWRRMAALVDAVRYCQRRRVPGAFVECGVWRGGSVLAMVLTLQELGADDRDIYLFDTFEDMTEPTEADTSAYSGDAPELWERSSGEIFGSLFGRGLYREDAVRQTLLETGYPPQRLHLLPGPVEETLPGGVTERLALLRLDTDWYESTRHELIHLYPLLNDGGVLIIDDYGHWEGCRRAVDEYFAHDADPLLLTRIDYTARIGIKH